VILEQQDLKIKTGDTLCDENTIILESMKFPAPVMVLQLSLKLKLT
jgi:hypothetical protein